MIYVSCSVTLATAHPLLLLIQLHTLSRSVTTVCIRTYETMITSVYKKKESVV